MSKSFELYNENSNSRKKIIQDAQDVNDDIGNVLINVLSPIKEAPFSNSFKNTSNKKIKTKKKPQLSKYILNQLEDNKKKIEGIKTKEYIENKGNDIEGNPEK